MPFLFFLVAMVHTHLNEYTHLVRSKHEYIAGPVPEFIVVGEKAVFEKPVEILISQPKRLGKNTAVRVLSGTETDYQVIKSIFYIPNTWANFMVTWETYLMPIFHKNTKRFALIAQVG